MGYAQYATVDPERPTEAVSIGQLRLWSTPKTIMVATNLADELTILPHAILQARQSNARILLVHIVDASNRVSTFPASWFRRSTFHNYSARPILDRMAQQLRWVGIKCDPVVLNGIPEIEIPRLAKAQEVDRLIMAFEDNPDLTSARNRILAERILPVMKVPVCLIGRRVGLSSPCGLKAKHVTLAVSLKSDCQLHLGFASRLAQDTDAKLAVLHVLPREHSQRSAGTASEVASCLPSQSWRETQLLCSAQITVREGEAAEEILKHNSSQNEGVIILCSSGITSAEQTWRNSVSYRVLAETRYPVFILEKLALQHAETQPILQTPRSIEPDCHLTAHFRSPMSDLIEN